MTKQEVLEQHVKQLAETKQKIVKVQKEMQTVEEEWVAKNKAFNEWISKELGINDVKEEVHLAEILTKWSGPVSRLIL